TALEGDTDRMTAKTTSARTPAATLTTNAARTGSRSTLISLLPTEPTELTIAAYAANTAVSSSDICFAERDRRVETEQPYAATRGSASLARGATAASGAASTTAWTGAVAYLRTTPASATLPWRA